jgi:alpha-glucosidase
MAGCLNQEWEAAGIASVIARIEEVFQPPALPAWYLGNHDNPRIVTRLGGANVGTARARLAALLLLTLRGVPFIYQGEELGLPDSRVSGTYRRDIDGREPQRVPMPWDAPSRVRGGGFTTGDPWLPLHDMAESLNVSSESRDKDSMLALYRTLIRLRRCSPALQKGELSLLESPAGIVSFTRHSRHSRVVVALNFRDAHTVARLEVPGASAKACLLASTNSARPRAPLDLGSVELSPHEGMVLSV